MTNSRDVREKLLWARNRLESHNSVPCEGIKLVDEVPKHSQTTLFKYFHTTTEPTPESISVSKSISQVEQPDSEAHGLMNTGYLSALATRVPERINDDITLLPYQISGVGWLISLMEQKSGGILAMDMGMGKTVQVVAALRLLSDATPRRKMTCLIACLPAMLGTWIDHLERICPGLRVFQYHGNRKQEVLDGIHTASSTSPGYVLLTTYDMIRRDHSILATAPPANEPWFCFVADEAQAFKNSDTAIFKAVCKLKVDSRILLTATPILNHYEELWSLMHFIKPTLLGDIKSFRNSYGDVIKYKAAPGPRQMAKIDRLRRLVTPYILRRMKNKESIADMVSRPHTTAELDRVTSKAEYKALVEVVMFFELSEIQKNAYSKCLTQMDHSRNVMVNITNLLNVCMIVSKFASIQDSPKIVFLHNVLPTWISQGHSVLIFSKWRKTLDALETSLLSLLQIPWARVDGSQSAVEKQNNIDRFQQSAEPMIMLVTTKAGGTGLTLTKADRVMILDPSWCGADDSQAIGRAHRISQRRDVVAYRMLYAGTIEEHMFIYQIRKLAASTQILRDANLKTELNYSDVKHFFTLIPARESIVIKALKKHVSPTAMKNMDLLLASDLGRDAKVANTTCTQYSEITSSDSENEAAFTELKRTSIQMTHPIDEDITSDLGFLSVFPMEEIIAQRSNLYAV